MSRATGPSAAVSVLPPFDLKLQGIGQPGGVHHDSIDGPFRKIDVDPHLDDVADAGSI